MPQTYIDIAAVDPATDVTVISNDADVSVSKETVDGMDVIRVEKPTSGGWSVIFDQFAASETTDWEVWCAVEVVQYTDGSDGTTAAGVAGNVIDTNNHYQARSREGSALTLSDRSDQNGFQLDRVGQEDVLQTGRIAGVRMRLEPDFTQRGKHWFESISGGESATLDTLVANESAGWDGSRVPTVELGAGQIGITGSRGGIYRFYAIGIGTDGDPAPTEPVTAEPTTYTFSGSAAPSGTLIEIIDDQVLASTIESAGTWSTSFDEQPSQLPSAVTVRASADGYITEEQVVTLDPEVNAYQNIEFALTEPLVTATFQGAVTDSVGAVVGASADLLDDADEPIAGATATTDASGDYSIAGVELEEGVYTLRFTDSNYVTQDVSVTVSVDTTTYTNNVTLVLAAGVITDIVGDPAIEGAEVRAAELGSAVVVGPETTSVQGRFYLSSLTAETEHLLWIRHDGNETVRVRMSS